MNMEEEKITGLPENASRELREGEEYKPLLSPDKNYPEVNIVTGKQIGRAHV